MLSCAAAKFRLGASAALVGAALVVAACGGSGSSSTAAATGASAGSSGSATAPATGPATGSRAATAAVKVGTHTGSAGTYLTGASGKALYLWVADTNGKSTCVGACASAWPPLVTKGAPTASHGVKAADLGTVKRAGGAEQVTYKGHPLYYYSGDTAAGTTTGQGSDGFGAKWWLVSPAGAAITSSASSSSSSSGGSGYGSGY